MSKTGCFLYGIFILQEIVLRFLKIKVFLEDVCWRKVRIPADWNVTCAEETEEERKN